MQIGSPMELYHNPQNTFVATFMGTPAMNVLKATEKVKFQDAEIQREEFFGYRPEKAMLDTKPMEAMFSLKSKVLTKEMLGSEILYKVENEFGEQNIKSGMKVSIPKILYTSMFHQKICTFLIKKEIEWRQVKEMNLEKNIHSVDQADIRMERKYRLKSNMTPYLLILPSMLVFLLFFILPLVFMGILSFSKWNLISPEIPWVGFDNYKSILQDPFFHDTLKNTFLYTVVYVVAIVAISIP